MITRLCVCAHDVICPSCGGGGGSVGGQIGEQIHPKKLSTQTRLIALHYMSMQLLSTC